MKKYILFVLLILVLNSLYTNERIPGSMMVMFKESNDRIAVQQSFLQRYQNEELIQVDVISKRFNIYLYHFNHRNTDDDVFLDLVRKDPNVYLAQFDYPVSKREMIPDDPRFPDQWSLKNTGQSSGTIGADIRATLAWDLVLANTDRNDREIVVAVIEDAFTLTHPDINWWKNTNEIIGSNIDNDGNGYIGDYHGWNAYNNTPNITHLTNANQPTNHGNHVSGIISAIANNGYGIAGVGWDVKVMPIQGSSTSQATVVRAYNYALENRILYNETDGQIGAFVVATNSSFGIDNGNIENFPIWGEMYDLMGAAGIISPVATANRNWDIDTVGDVPSAFPSPYLISVTNTDRNDIKNTSAGYGLTTIHLGAPGTMIWSTTASGHPNTASFTTATMSGTSMATPHVAGVISLMYKAATDELLDYYKDTPDVLASLFRQFLLDGVIPNNSLSNRTITGGRLDALNPIMSVLEKNISVGYEGKEFTENPIITPPAGFYTETQIISISCPTDGAVIYYTLDGSAPTPQSLLYTNSFEINETITIRARAFAPEHAPSEIITNSYTFMIPVQTISELRAFSQNTTDTFVLLSEVIVSMTQPDIRNQTYIQDETAGILINDLYGILPNYEIGDKIIGLVGKLNLYNEMLQFVPEADLATVISQNNIITPIEVTFAEIIDSLDTYQAILVKVNRVRFDTSGYFANETDYPVHDPSANYTFRTNFFDTDYIDTPLPVNQVNITGIISIGNTGSYITARFNNDIEAFIVPYYYPPQNFDGQIAMHPDSYIYLHWTEPLQTEDTLIGYFLYRDDVKLTPNPIVNTYINTPNLSYGSYLFGIRAVYSSGMSEIIYRYFFVYNLLPIRDLEIELDRYDVIMTWKKPLGSYDMPLGYLIIRNDEEIGYIEPTNLSDLIYVDKAVPFGINNYSLRAHYERGYSDDVFAEVIIDELLAPAEFTAKLLGNDVVLSWLPPVTIGITLEKYVLYKDETIIKIHEIDSEDDLIYIDIEVESGNYRYSIIAVYKGGASESLYADLEVSEDDVITPNHVTELYANYPNPFNPNTVISFNLETANYVSIEIFNIRGQRIKTLLNEFKDKGTHQVSWNGIDDSGNSVGSGIYFYQMITDDFSAVKRMMMIK